MGECSGELRDQGLIQSHNKPALMVRGRMIGMSPKLLVGNPGACSKQLFKDPQVAITLDTWSDPHGRSQHGSEVGQEN